MLERLQKIISRAGIASRRHAEHLILSGAVTVNGRVVTELGEKADAARDHITVGPRKVRLEDAPERYAAFYKPAQVVSTMSDPEGRPCLGPYLRGFKGRLFPVGRLDFDAAGLLLLTSDGALASDLMRGASVIPQTWRFKVKGRITGDTQQHIERAAGVRVRIHRDAANAWYEAELPAGGPRNRLGEALMRHGVLVEKMLRWSYGGVALEGLAPGTMRELTAEELRALRRALAGRVYSDNRKTKFDHRISARRTADDGILKIQDSTEGTRLAPPVSPERAGMARAVEHWRAKHPRAARRGAKAAPGGRHAGQRRHAANHHRKRPPT